MPATQHDLPWTAVSAIALPADGNRYEVLDGEFLVTPSSTHTEFLVRLIQSEATLIREVRFFVRRTLNASVCT